ncbi:transglycosylase SLT domain-containing protein [Pedobacter sp. BS3]|uniref:lytic transglycosylase domain-containing protein n=1 Tax=Pedobacter sp. BS3 TaxID=2567937 RepID=UPI0011EF9E19|nr:lytic transglycosylase domain-containing protein [Pedobacter sp. BS3]TZF83190.1 transglycosylase SLT domain-containing protein [Pedobacter sp. BS3]
MMRKIMAVAMGIAACTLTANAYTGTESADSTKAKALTRSSVYLPDSLFTIPAEETPVSSFQNIVYKQRLDSLRQTIPLTYNEHTQYFIDVYLDRRKEDFGRIIGLSNYYFPIYEQILKEMNVPQELKYVSVVESSLNPNAVSRSGATGPWQFMYTTAKGYGLTIDNYVDERKDPVSACYAAATYFRDAFNQFGDWLLAIASYNCGMGAVSRAITRAGGIADFWAIRSYLPLETRNYVPAFIATVYLMNNYEKHGIVARDPGFPVRTDILPVSKTISLASIAKLAGIDSEYLAILNPAYKKAIINGSAAAPKQVILPQTDKSNYTALYQALNSTDGEMQTVAVADGTAKVRFHRVKQGENIAAIANKYGVEVQDLKVWNNLKGTLLPGQILRILPAMPEKTVSPVIKTYIAYRVKAGDTLANIVERFAGSSVADIKANNSLVSTSLKPGMILKISTNEL